jgi:hypothetical protein
MLIINLSVKKLWSVPAKLEHAEKKIFYNLLQHINIGANLSYRRIHFLGM